MNDRLFTKSVREQDNNSMKGLTGQWLHKKKIDEWKTAKNCMRK